MANSNHDYPIISAGQSSKEVTANSMDLAGSPALLWGIDPRSTTGLTWGLLEGVLNVAGTPTQIAKTTVTLTASQTNYVEATTAGVVSANTSGFTAGRLRLYTVVTGTATVTSYTDHRSSATGAGITGSVGGGDVVGPSSAVNNRVAFFDGTTGKLIKDSGLTLSGTNTGDQTSVSGNAGTATALQTARTIGGVSFDGTANITQPFDVHAFHPGVPANSAILLRVPIARAVSFAANFAGSYGKASANATGSTAIDVQKNGSSVGTITYAAGASTATFASSGGAAVSFAAGDLLSIHGPGTADATLADIGIVLAGTR
jgi:hypothetical protein